LFSSLIFFYFTTLQNNDQDSQATRKGQQEDEATTIATPSTATIATQSTLNSTVKTATSPNFLSSYQPLHAVLHYFFIVTITLFIPNFYNI
jgi:hypothetical protein